MIRPAHQMPDRPPVSGDTTFHERLRARAQHSLLCVGIDPPLETVSTDQLSAYGRRLVDATVEWACLYKPNIAFFEARGIEVHVRQGRKERFDREPVHLGVDRSRLSCFMSVE